MQYCFVLTDPIKLQYSFGQVGGLLEFKSKDDLMRNTLFILIIFFLKLQPSLAIELPKRIVITDQMASPWSTNYSFKYELHLKNEIYELSTKHSKDGKRQKRIKQVVEKALIENILLTAARQDASTIRANDFKELFATADIKAFLKMEGQDAWIRNEQQLEYLMNQLTDTTLLKKNLEHYYQNYDHSRYIDGTSTEVCVVFYFADMKLTISSNSILSGGLPLKINGQKNYSLALAELIGQLIPQCETKRAIQFSDQNIFNAVITEALINHGNQISQLESYSYNNHLDSLKQIFQVTKTRVIRGWSTTNWDGERRLNCTLMDSALASNISINYSTTIEDDAIKYPVSNITTRYSQLYASVMAAPFFRDYLSAHDKRQLTIIFDDNSCFTAKAKEFATKGCLNFTDPEKLSNALFISLENEAGDISRWGLLPNGQYFMWWHNGSMPMVPQDPLYIVCQ